MTKRKSSASLLPPSKKTAPPASSILSSAILPAPAPPSDYRTFLDRYISGKGKGSDKTYLSKPKVEKWQDVNVATPEGQIINEIAKKFNTTPAPLGISTVEYAPNVGGDLYYRSDPNKSPKQSTTMRLAAPAGARNKFIGADPRHVGHELIHANDHQIDRLNPSVWRNLGALATTGGIPAAGAPTSITDFAGLQNSLKRIQDKIDPVNFYTSYKFSQPHIEAQMQGARGGTYSTPLTGGAGSTPDWSRLFNDINTQVTSPAPAGGVSNQGFYFPYASEYPAFMSENLTRPWNANGGADPLSLPEARFLHSTLGNMEAAYPDTLPGGAPGSGYPIMNQHIKARRSSLENAYYPGTPGTPGIPPSPGNPGTLPTPAVPPGPPGGVFSHGGRVKSPSKKQNFFDYFNRKLKS